jgi:hypothetical protein
MVNELTPWFWISCKQVCKRPANAFLPIRTKYLFLIINRSQNVVDLRSSRISYGRTGFVGFAGTDAIAAVTAALNAARAA